MGYGTDAQGSRQTISLLSGLMTFAPAPEVDNSTNENSNIKNIHLEWGKYLDPNSVIVIAYRIGQDDETSLVKYQATTVSSRLFLFNGGVNHYSEGLNTIVTYDFVFALYVEYGGGLGRFLHDKVKLAGHLEKTATFLAPSVGAGCYFHIGAGLILDINIRAEYALGISGSVDGFTSLNSFALFGVKIAR